MKQRARFLPELFCWALALTLILHYVWSDAHREYWIPLTSRSVLSCEDGVHSLLVDRSTPEGIVSHNGGIVTMSSVTSYGVCGEVVYGIGNSAAAPDAGQWFVIETNDKSGDPLSFVSETEWAAALQKMGIATTSLLKPSFAQADLNSVGPGARFGLIVAAAIFLSAILRLRRAGSKAAKELGSLGS